MSSGYTPKWRRILYKTFPFLIKKCPEGNYHWALARLCFCRIHEHSGNWHGGILDFKTNSEYQECEICK